jgi:hypothetical protein
VWGEAGFPGELLAAPFQPPRSTIFPTEWLLTPSMPVSSSALAACLRSRRDASAQ